MRQFGGIGFPILPIKRHNRQDGCLTGIKAIGVDADPVRIGPWCVEGFDTTLGAKGMIGDACIEAVRGELIGPCRQFKIVHRHNQVNKARARTDRAIAGLHLDLIRRFHTKAHIATMA